LIEAKEELKRRRQLSMADYLAEKAQLKIQFGEE
jgi:hypothetical protein